LRNYKHFALSISIYHKTTSMKSFKYLNLQHITLNYLLKRT